MSHWKRPRLPAAVSGSLAAAGGPASPRRAIRAAVLLAVAIQGPPMRLARAEDAPSFGAAALTSAAPAEGIASREAAPRMLSVAPCRDIPANGRLFQRGLPVTRQSFSPDGFHFAYLHTIPGGILRRKPQRCVFLLDLATGENGPAKAPEGEATRLGGWDPTGRYLLIETTHRGFFSALTSRATTYHWVYDVIVGDFVTRRPFTGMRDGTRFLWKATTTYHGVWGGADHNVVWPLYEGELADSYRERDEEMDRETERRAEFASHLGVESGDRPAGTLASVLPRLDEHWTQRGHRDPVVSELFGERPTLFWEKEGRWVEIRHETEYVAVLDRGLALITGQGGAQTVFCPERWELLLLPPVPTEFIERLETRWDRPGGFFDEDDPLPRDLQYRRSVDAGRGLAHYFNYVTPDRKRLLVLYVLGPEERILRIVDLPESWLMDRPPRTTEGGT